MNLPSTRFFGRLGLLSAAMLLSSCALPREEAWRIIKQDGLIPYLAIEMGHRDPPRGTMVARRTAPVQQQPVSRFWDPTPPTATPVPWKPVPTPPSPVLVTRSADGTTKSTTRVESRPKPMNSAPRSSPAMVQVDPSSGKAVPTAPVKSAAEALGATKPVPAPSPTPAVNVAEAKPKAEAPKTKPADAPKPKAPEQPVAQAAQKPAPAKPTADETPYGVPVPGRPGLVNSPYAGKLQLVDVTGLKPGQEVKCPYSGKLFRVPPGATAEARQTGEAPSKKQ